MTAPNPRRPAVTGEEDPPAAGSRRAPRYRLMGVPLALPVLRDLIDGQHVIEDATGLPVQRWRCERDVTARRAAS